MSTYITKQGDTWDGVAYKACGSEPTAQNGTGFRNMFRSKIAG